METLATISALLIPLFIFAVAGFKAWRTATTHRIAQRVMRKHKDAHQGGIAIVKFGVLLYEVPVCAATLRLYGVK